ncbi:mechanosensitive ion channel family protein [Sphingomonas sp.]|uniref:mechanosensitive ion channel family protein n=1 Tax=Sphingomonas sp. TaxID=28214 RepID=UPI0035C7B1E2
MKPVTPPPIREPGSLILAKAHAWVNGFFLQLPNIIAAIVFLVVAWFAAKGVAAMIRKLADRRDRYDLGALLGSIAFGAIMIAALLMAAAIVFPSVKPGDVLATLGIGSVAIGFAFKDILQNLFAGLLLLIRRPFRRGDQIVVKDYEGTVEHIESRATLLKTYDGRRVIIPNADLYIAPVVVNTAFPTRREQLDIGIGYGDDVARACQVFTETMAGIDGIVPDPKPETLPWGLDASTVTLRARWWTDSKRTNVVHIKARVVEAIVAAAKAHAIDLAYPTTQVLFHDQTEEVDGDRTRQREGWPAGDSPPAPRRR